MEHREQRRKEAEAEYEKKAAVIDGKREKWLADYMKKGKVREVTRVPLGEVPENFVETKREMNGRYGWFESSARYNLPEYVSGYAFDSKRLADSYRKFDGRKADAYRELVSGADLDFDPVETARRNSEMRRSEQEGADARLSVREAALRDALVDKMRKAGMDVSTDWKEGQRVLDDINGRATLSRGKKRALETVSVSSDEEHQQTVVSSADGAKIMNNLDTLAKNIENILHTPLKTFIGDVANALGAKRYGSKSQYATFETKNGQTVTIRLADHNATVSNFDRRNEFEGISIVVTPKDNAGITNDGSAHVVEFFYDSIKLRRADGKPLAAIVRSIQQALYSGEYKDTTGLAEREEVNMGQVREHRAYHGSAADFDMFDHSHMGEGEGAQAYGWGSYLTEVEGIGRTYARSSAAGNNRNNVELAEAERRLVEAEYVERQTISRMRDAEERLIQLERTIEVLQTDISEYTRRRRELVAQHGEGSVQVENFDFVDGEILEEDTARLKRLKEESVPETKANLEEFKSDLEQARQTVKVLERKLDEIEKSIPILYSVEIPDDNGSNYLYYEKPVSQDLQAKAAEGLKSRGFEETTLRNGHTAYVKGASQVVFYEGQKGADFYEELAIGFADELGSAGKRTDSEGDRMASEFLHELGVIGVKYPAEFRSGGRNDGKHNFVMFNEGDMKIVDKARFFRTRNGDAYGFTLNGKIFLDPRIATSETAVHEYSHLWAQALRKGNADEWRNVTGLMKDSPVWDEVRELYPELRSEDEIAEEVLSLYSGRKGAERLRKAQDDALAKSGGSVEVAKTNSVFNRVRRAIRRFWKGVADFLHIRYGNVEEVADRVMADLIEGVNPQEVLGKRNEDRDDVRFSLGDPADTFKERQRKAVEMENLERVNQVFNARLDELTRNPNLKNRVLQLGRPSGFLLGGGISDGPIILEYDKFVRKSSVKYKHNHPFSAEDIKDLPKAINNPIAVFNSKNVGDKVILTELQKDGKNFIVAVRAKEQSRKGGVILEINEITTLYPKNVKGIVKWFIDGYLTQIEKEKALRWIEALRPHVGTTISNEELNSAAKVIESFENSKFSDKKNSDDSTDKEYEDALRRGDNDRAKRLVDDRLAEYLKGHSYTRSDVAHLFGDVMHRHKEDAEAWGIRFDKRLLVPEDVFPNSHELYQDYMEDEDGEQLYPDGEGPYSGFYDAGELDGTSTLLIGNKADIEKALSKPYAGNYVYLVAGDYNGEGRDAGEVLIGNAKVFSVMSIPEGVKGVDKNNDLNHRLFTNKSIDTATYDDNGNLIPLSQRFNQSADDVRFSLGDRLSDPMGRVRGAVERVGKAEDRERDVKEQFDRTRQRGIDTADRILDDATSTDKQRHQRMTDVIREVTRIDGLRKVGKETVRERVRSITDTLTEMIPATDEFTRGEVKRLIGKIDKAMDVKDVKRNVREAVNIVLKSGL